MLIRQLRERMGVLLVEHHMDLVMSTCDRLVVLNFGRADRIGLARGRERGSRGHHRHMLARTIAKGHPGENADVPTAGKVDAEDATAEEGHEALLPPPSTGRKTVLEVEGLSVSYGAICALEEVALQAEKGMITAVLGAERRRQDDASAHDHRARETDERDRSPRRREAHGDGGRGHRSGKGVAHVPEGRGVIQELTVDENLRLGALWSTEDTSAALR